MGKLERRTVPALEVCKERVSIFEFQCVAQARRRQGLLTGLASYYHLVFRIYIFIQIETLDKLNLHLFHLIVIALYSHLIMSVQQQQQQQYNTISFAFFTVMSASPGNYIEKENGCHKE